MKKIIFLTFFSLASIYSFSQEVYKKSYDTTQLEGTWIATSGNKSYEITFVKGTIYAKNMNVILESIFGYINYLEDNKIIRSTDISSLESVRLRVFRKSEGLEFEIHYSETDNGKRINGNVKFDINPDGKTARWYNLYKTRLWGQEIPKETFDIPKELMFTKKPSTKSQNNDQAIPHFEFP